MYTWERTGQFSIVLLLLVVLMLLAAVPATGAGVCTRPDPRDVAEVEAREVALYFHPLEDYDSMLLRVTGPYGFIFEERVATRKSAVFELSKDTVDGCYTFEVRTAPILPGEVLEILAEARQKDDADAVYDLQREGRLPEYTRTQSGGFKVIEGQIMLDDRPEKAFTKESDAGGAAALTPTGAAAPMTPLVPPKDYVINDDLIVTGSACVGWDCFNGWSFGFTTIAMSENNVRLKFDDTSTLASYPRNDWWLVANDTTNGGANRFSIEDCGDDSQGDCTSPLVPFTVEATAPSHSLYVDDYGRVGLGTSTPYVEIHVADGDTPTLRLDQDGSAGWVAQVWDLAANETNFFLRDVTNGSSLVFRAQPGAPSNSLTIRSSGNVGIGTWSPQADLHIDMGTSDPANFRVSGDSAGFDLQDLNGAVDRKVVQQFVNDGLWRVRGLNDGLTGETVTGIALDLSNGRVGIGNASSLGFPLVVGTDATNGNGAHVTNGGVWTNGSSRQSKEAITVLGTDEAVDALAGLEPVRFRYRYEPAEEYVGFIAEDVPELVATASRRHLSPMDIVAVLTKVVQEQQETIAGLEERIAKLEGDG